MVAYALFGLLCVGMGVGIFMLSCAYIDIENERERARAGAKPVEALCGSDRFFVTPPASDEDVPEPVDERVVIRLEEYLKKEREIAAHFVAEPSVERLYQRSERPALMN